MWEIFYSILGVAFSATNTVYQRHARGANQGREETATGLGQTLWANQMSRMTPAYQPLYVGQGGPVNHFNQDASVYEDPKLTEEEMGAKCSSTKGNGSREVCGYCKELLSCTSDEVPRATFCGDNAWCRCVSYLSVDVMAMIPIYWNVSIQRKNVSAKEWGVASTSVITCKSEVF